MAVSRELKRRIKSVNSSKQITKAMELVSTAKMRRATAATLANRPYASRLSDIYNRIASVSEQGVSHPLMEAHEGNTTLLIAIASDQGLAGAYNANVIKQSTKIIKEEQAAGRKVISITLGKKIFAVMNRLGIEVIQNYPLSAKLEFDDLHALYAFAIDGYMKRHFNKVQVVYTDFQSMLKQEVTSVQLLPFVEDERTAAVLPTTFIYEPSDTEVLSQLLPYIVEVRLYQAALESSASEHSSRRIAMKNASDNAKSVIDRLTLTYNSLRQGAITQEIAEITSGAAALQQ